MRWESETYPSRSAMAKATWADPDIRKKRIESRSKSMKDWWADPKNYERMLKKRRKQAKSKGWKEAVSSAQKRKWAEPEYRKKMRKVRQKQAADPKLRANMSAAIEAKWEDKVYRKRVAAGRKKAGMYTAKWRANVSAGCKGRGNIWSKGLTKHTDVRLMRMSKRLAGTIPDYNKYRAWYPSDRKKEIHMRSRWEVGYALYLDKKGIEWKYEPKYFYVGEGKWTGTHYIPDFYLPASRWYVELKGRAGYGWKAKFAEFKKRYPKVRIKVLWAEQLKAKGVLDVHGCAVYRKAA